MIDELHAENVALIRTATIELAPGLTVITGETGAGKTALLGALKLLMGERGDASTVREGADGLTVEGRFFTEGAGDDGVVVRRHIDASGRGRVSIDGRMASVRELAEGIGATMDLCGQHEHQRLLRQQAHVGLLDAWIGPKAHLARQAFQEALARAREAADELERIRELGRHANERIEDAAFVLRRIDEVGPSLGELEELEEALPRAEHADSLMRATDRAREALAGDGGALDALGTAVSALEDARRYDESLAGFSRPLQSALIDLEDVAGELRSYADQIDVDPAAFDAMQDRMAALQGLMRTYGPRMEDVLQRRSEASDVIEAARDQDGAERGASEALAMAERVLADAAASLNEIREQGAPELARAITAEMAGLEMGSASVELVSDALPREHWSAQGPTRIELLYRPAPEMTARPLRRIASGGEVSRVMLACKVVLGKSDDASTLVFDEVDAGVGGTTAIALGNMLARLAESHQVIVVTHLAQVAVQGARHYVVCKRATEGAQIPETVISEVRGEDRVAEIARMLSGDVGKAARAHAREMLNQQQSHQQANGTAG